MLLLGNSPLKYGEFNLDKEYLCRNEIVASALEVDGGSVVVLIDIRKECKRRMVEDLNEKLKESCFCSPLPDGRSEKLNGILALAFDIYIAEQEHFNVTFDLIVSLVAGPGGQVFSLVD
jgi:hypothetical protein